MSIGDPVYRYVSEVTFTIDDEGNTETVLIGTDPWRTKPTDTPPNAPVAGVVVHPGAVSWDLFAQGRVAGPINASTGDLICANGAPTLDAEGILDDWLAYGIGGSKVVTRRGLVGAAYPAEYFVCYVLYVKEHEVGTDQVHFHLVDRMDTALDVPLITDTFAGTGGMEGAGGAATPPAIVSGDPGYYPITLLDYVNQLYSVHSCGTMISLTQYYRLYEGGIEVEREDNYSSVEELLTVAPSELKCRFYFGAVSAYAPAYFLTGPVYVRRGTPPAGDQRVVGYATPNDDDFALNDGQYVSTFTAAALARRAGIANSDIDGQDTSLQSFRTDDPALTVKDALAKLCQATQSFCHFTRLDKFRSGHLLEPDDGDSVATITDAQSTQGLRRVAVPGMPSPVWKVSVRAGKTWPCTVLAGASAEMKDRLTREVSSTIQGVADGTKLRNPGAIVEALDMENLYVVNALGRDTFLERYFSLYGGRRDYYTFTLPMTSENVAWNLHDVVTLQSPRFGLSAGQKFRIVSIAMDLGGDTPTLTFGVWGGVPGVYTGTVTKIPTGPTVGPMASRYGVRRIPAFRRMAYASVSTAAGAGGQATRRIPAFRRLAYASSAAVDPDFGSVSLLMRFESGLLVDENTIQTNTFGSTGSPVRSTTSPQWGTGSGEINETTNQQSFYAQAPTNFRASGAAATLDLWVYPISQGNAGGGTASLRNVFLTLATDPVIDLNPSSNVVFYLRWIADSGGEIVFAGGGSATAAANTWHHVRMCWDSSGQLQAWVDGTRFVNTATGGSVFSVISVGNQKTAGLELDGDAGDHLTRCRVDSIRMTTGVARSTGSTITVPTEDFPTQ